jgi:hypothetical protein
LDGTQFSPERGVEAAPQLAERLGEHKVRWRARRLVLLQATGLPHGKVGAQALAAILIASAPFMLE